MNENPEGTPNPLNSNPEPVGAPDPVVQTDSVSEAPVTPIETAKPTEQATPAEPVTPAEPIAPVEPVAPARPDTPVAPTAPYIDATQTDPMARPMEKAPVAAAKPKKKTGLIIAILLCLLIAVGCAVTAILLTMNPKGSDPVTSMLNKLMAGETPNVFSVDGKIDVEINDDYTPFSRISVDLDGKFYADNPTHSVDASVTLKPTRGVQDISLNVNEAYFSDGDLYLKLDDVSSLINLMTDGYESATTGITNLLEGEWIRISAEDMKPAIEGYTNAISLSCFTDAAETEDDKKAIIDLYNNYPFIVSSTENMSVTSRRDPIYKLGFDSTKMQGFVDGLSNTRIIRNIEDCLDVDFDFDSIKEEYGSLSNELPEVYVEVNNDNNLTRLYAKFEISEGGDVVDCDGYIDSEDCAEMNSSDETVSDVAIDLTFSYPDSHRIIEPNSYKDYKTLIQQLFQQTGL